MMKTLLLFILSLPLFARDPLPASRFSQLTGQKITQSSKSRWDQKYNRSYFIYGKSPSSFLAENYKYIPAGSSVLDMGMGEGRNAVFLAQKGYQVTGIDISSIAVKKAFMLAKEYGVKIKGVVASLKEYKIKPGTFDAIICFYYVDRSLVESIKKWLKPGGVIIYEAYTTKQREKESEKNEAESSFLKSQELFHLFKGMNVLKFEEPLFEKDFRSSIILQKPE